MLAGCSWGDMRGYPTAYERGGLHPLNEAIERNDKPVMRNANPLPEHVTKIVHEIITEENDKRNKKLESQENQDYNPHRLQFEHTEKMLLDLVLFVDQLDLQSDDKYERIDIAYPQEQMNMWFSRRAIKRAMEYLGYEVTAHVSTRVQQDGRWITDMVFSIMPIAPGKLTKPARHARSSPEKTEHGPP